MFKGPLPIRINHRRLVSDNAKLEGTIPLERFERLIELLDDRAGDVHARLEFRRGYKRRGLVVGNLEASVSMICQNCMQVATVEVSAEIRLLIVNSETALAALAEEDDGIVCLEDQVLLVDLLEDDLILSMPMVGRHAEGECAVEDVTESRPMPVVPVSPTKETYRPFAGLTELTEGLFKKH